mmetsp:Transcript_55085/g.128919  ORF Transcript_55085/g.128919 Transcript_55085/m.128919 type:complete len:499 (+) Transcript_55085:43-1539(+)
MPAAATKSEPALGRTLKLDEEHEEVEAEEEEDPEWAAEWAALTELRKAVSEPTLMGIKLPAIHRDYARSHRPLVQQPSPKDVVRYRKGIKELQELLGDNAIYRRDAARKAKETRRGKALAASQIKRASGDIFHGTKPHWYHIAAPGHFMDALFNNEEQEQISDKRLLRFLRAADEADAQERGGSIAPDPGTAVLAKERGWKEHNTNEKHEQLAEFGAKARQRMSNSEKMFAERLDSRLHTIQEGERHDALYRTSGSMRKKDLEENAPEFSVMNPKRRMWRDQLKSTMPYFSTPDPYLPGERGYDTALMALVAQPWRTFDYSLDIVVSDPDQTRHWQQPEESMRGTAKRLQEAQQLSRSSWDRTRPQEMQATGRRVEGVEAEHALLEEFATAMMYKYPNAVKAFRIFDINGNGYLSLSEFAQYAKTFYTGDATSVFKALDHSRCGSLQVDDFVILQQLEDKARQKALQDREERRLRLREKRAKEKQNAAKQLRKDVGRE